jgi:hypothetical protein
MKELDTSGDDDHDLFGKPWGDANPRRGLNYREYAKTFVKDHPVGTVISGDDLDHWLQKMQLLTIPPLDSPKDSDAWLGHLQRRHITRNRINKAATHPRMTEENSTPFIILAIQGGFEIRAPHTAITKSELPRKLKTLIETKRKQLAYLMQSADWTALPPHERSVAETLYDDIDNFTDDIKIGADRISRKLAKLESRIKRALDDGSIKPKGNAIKQLLLEMTPEDAEDNEFD